MYPKKCKLCGWTVPNDAQRLMYVACATAVVLDFEDSEKAKRTDCSPLKVEFLTHFYEYE